MKNADSAAHQIPNHVTVGRSGHAFVKVQAVYPRQHGPIQCRKTATDRTRRYAVQVSLSIFAGAHTKYVKAAGLATARMRVEGEA